MFLLAGGLGYQLDRQFDQEFAYCPCPTLYHPPFVEGFSAMLGTLFSGLALGLAFAVGADPAWGKKASGGLLTVSIIAIAMGDQFLLGGGLGLISGAMAFGAVRGA